jgi:hypothetical protein
VFPLIIVFANPVVKSIDGETISVGTLNDYESLIPTTPDVGI